MFLFCGQAHINYQGDFMDDTILRILEQLPRTVKKFYIENINRNITEIRIRQGFDIKIAVDGLYVTVKESKTDKEFLSKLYYYFCDNTVSAYEDQTSRGYITLTGGHRVGLAGKFTLDLQGKTVLSEVYSMNIRLAEFHYIEIPDRILDFQKGLLISGKPHTGKTNFIRNICYSLKNYNLVICDERNELYSPDINGDFIINQPKAVAVMQALRTMNPDYIICDEIGNEKDTAALLNGVNSGVAFVCTVHADCLQTLKSKPEINTLLDMQVFDKVVFVNRENNNFYSKEVYDL